MSRPRSVGGTARLSDEQPPIDEPPDTSYDAQHEVDADPESIARIICLRLLTARSCTRAELAEALRARNVPYVAAEAVLNRFTQVGLINDAEFAQTFAMARHNERGLSAREIGRQLREKGVDESVISKALSGIGAESESEAARRLVERKARSMQSLDAATKTRRLVGLLARKGYAPNVAYGAVSAVLSDDVIPVSTDLD